jgi:alpha-glucosidase
MPGAVSPELYARWIQFGVFSPILRTHTTKNPDAERRIWAYPPKYASVMRDAFQLRYALLPYVYTQARKTYDSGVAFLRPLYYDYPNAPEAYEVKDEYTFGDDMIVSPIVTELNKNSQLATKSVWLPDGEWIEWSSGAHLKGPAKIDRTFALSEVPVFVRAGAVIPMAPKMPYSEAKPVDPLILAVMPGASGGTSVYADQGNSLGYKSSEFAWTAVKQSREGDTVHVTVAPVEGSYPGMPQDRSYEFHLFGVFPPKHVAVNGQELQFTRDETKPGWRYDGNRTMVVITSPRFKVSEGVELAAELPHVTEAQQQALDGLPGHITRLRTAMDVLNGTWQKGWSPDSLIAEYQVGDRMTYFPDHAIAEAEVFQAQWPKMIGDVLAMQPQGIDRDAIMQALMHLGVEVQMKAAAGQ